jgi:hypothetical protein
MVSLSTVLEKITYGFQSMTYPGDFNIVYDNSENNLECVGIQQTFVGKHWTELTLETLVEQKSALGFMTPEAFRFYLPAYMSIVLQEFEETDVLPDNTVFYLTLPLEVDQLYQLNAIQNLPNDIQSAFGQSANEIKPMINQFLVEELSRSTQKVHDFMERVSGFDQQQAQAIRYYLECLSENKDYFFRDQPQVAIERYWFIFPL